MTRNVEWDEFLANLISQALEKQKTTKEYEYLHQRRAHIDEMLATNLTDGEKEMVDEALYELGLASERETELSYRQGLRDCVWLLKNLGVLA